MQELSEYTKRHWDVVVIGGGATGAGTLRDLAMRGVKALLLEQRDLVHGTSSRFHGLLHSGARYAVKDAEAGRECIEENRILRRIGKHCVEETEGFFVRTPEDGAEFEATWVTACDKCGIEATPLTVKEARALEPNLAGNIVSVYRVPDSAVDGFRLVWQNVQNAVRHGAGFRTYTEVTSINSANGQVTSVSVRDSRTGQTGEIPCSFVVNAAGSWVGELAHTAGLDINVKPDRGTLVAFNHRFTSRVINRLRKASDGDIFVPHGSITILGTTSKKTDKPDDTVPDTAEVHELLDIGRVLFPEIDSYRILRTFAGTRPLYTADPSAEGRGASRNFVVLDHEKEGLKGMATICGGKLTTYRLMGERMADLAEFEQVASEPTSHSLNDIRRRTRMGMGTCQGSFCGLRGVGAVLEAKLLPAGMQACGTGECDALPCGAPDLLQSFQQERWYGIRPVLWGSELRETELARGMYGATLNVDGADE